MLIPNFIALPAVRFAELAASDDRADETIGLLDADQFPMTDVDKYWLGLRAALAGTAAVLAIDGAEVWEDDPRTVVLDSSAVNSVSTALADVRAGGVEAAGGEVVEEVLGVESGGAVAEALMELRSFYAAAAERGDSVVIIFN